MTALQILSDLIAVDTVGANERELTDYCQKILDTQGMQTTVVGYEPGREQLVAYHGGDAPLTFTGHLDTVPVNLDDWDTDPWTPTVDGDRLAGRGASDMKSGVAATLVALQRHLAADHECRGVQVILTGGEEIGALGAAAVDAVDLRRGGPLVVAEPTANAALLGHKGALWLRLNASGVAAHGSAPDLGDNAAVRMARAAVALHDVADWPTSPRFGPTTANVGVLRGGMQINVVPDAAELMLDMRHGPEVDPAALRQRVGELAGTKVEVHNHVVLPPIDTPDGGEFVGLVQGALLDTGLDTSIGAPARYFTDASVLSYTLSENGDPVPTVILGPGEPDQCHVANEWCSVSRLDRAVDVYEALLARWCGLTLGE